MLHTQGHAEGTASVAMVRRNRIQKYPQPWETEVAQLETHLLVVLLQVGQLFLQALDLHLQVGSGQGQLVQHPAQAIGVGLHAYAQVQLRLVPENQLQNSLGNQHIHFIRLLSSAGVFGA